MRRKSYITGLFLLLMLSVSAELSAQGLLNRAMRQYDSMSYEKSAEMLQRYLKRKDNFDAKVKLAECYRRLGNFRKAEKAWESVVIDARCLPYHKLRYGQVLKRNGNYAAAKKWFLDFVSETPDTALGMTYVRSVDRALALMQDSAAYNVSLVAGVNGRGSDIAPVPYQDGIAFSSQRRRGFLILLRTSADGEPFYDMYFARRGLTGVFEKPKYMKGVNSKYHDGPASFTRSGNKVFISRSRRSGRRKRNVTGVSKLNIYSMNYVNGSWKSEESYTFNSSEFNLAHPTVNGTGTMMVFASDIPGGYGGTDLYVSYRDEGRWSTPRNLGPEVNTEANEVFPYLLNDSTVYFSSDRADGLGGLDIFIAKGRREGWSGVRNLGYPLNSPGDDFGISWIPGKAEGYLSSSRAGIKGEDDIYTFRKFPAVNGRVLNSRTGEPVRNADITVMDINQKSVTYTTDEYGEFRHFLTTGKDLFITIRKDDYVDIRKGVSVRDLAPGEDLNLDIPLEEIPYIMIKGQVTDAKKGVPLPGAQIQLLGDTDAKLKADEDGRYAQVVNAQTEYTVVIHAPGYRPVVKTVETPELNQPHIIRIDGPLVQGPYVFVTGSVKDKDLRIPVSDGRIKVTDLQTQAELEDQAVRKDGRFFLALNPAKGYSLIATSPNYFTSRMDLEPKSIKTDTLHAPMQLLSVKEGEVFKTIYFGYNASETNLFGKRDLKEISYFLEDNPEINLELAAHTDASGRAEYNLTLSQQRAESAKAYLVQQGIDPSRITAVGYGESRLVNQCADGIECPPEMHDMNRRCEVRIIRPGEQDNGQNGPIEEEEGNPEK